MHDSSTLYVGVLSNSTEPRGNIYVRHRYSIGYVHRPGPRRYFRVSLEHELNIARALHTHFLESHFVHYSSGEFPSQIIIRPRGLPLNARIAMEKLILILTNGRSLSVSVHDPLQDGPPEGFVIPRGTNDRLANVGQSRRESAGRQIGAGRPRRSVRAGMSRVRAGCTKGRTMRKRETAGEREKEGGTSADARRLGTRVRRPTEARFGCQSTPHPKLDSSSSNESAVSVGSPSGTGGGSGAQRVERSKCGALAPGESADDGIRFVALATCHSVLSRSTVHSEKARHERKN